MSETKKLSYNDCLVVYREGETNIISLLNPETKESLYVKGRTLEGYQEEYPGCKLYTWEEVMPLLEEAQDKNFVTEFKEITEEQWWDMYECLPPYKTKRTDKYFRFLCSEYWSGNITGHYYEIQRRFFSANRRDTDNSEDHYNQIIEKFFNEKEVVQPSV